MSCLTEYCQHKLTITTVAHVQTLVATLVQGNIGVEPENECYDLSLPSSSNQCIEVCISLPPSTTVESSEAHPPVAESTDIENSAQQYTSAFG